MKDLPYLAGTVSVGFNPHPIPLVFFLVCIWQIEDLIAYQYLSVNLWTLRMQIVYVTSCILSGINWLVLLNHLKVLQEHYCLALGI